MPSEPGAGTAGGQAPRERLAASTKLVYSAPAFVGAAMAIPVLVHMQPFYSDVLLVPVGTIAIAIAIVRSFDALTDPLIGWVSDRTHTRWGRRKPWILGGALACAVAFYLLMNPPASLSPAEVGYWFALTFAAYFLLHTAYEVPYAGLGAELSSDYHERSSLFGLRSMFIGVGTIVAGALPTVLDGAGVHDKRRVFHLMSAGYAGLFVLLFSLLVLFVRERPHDERRTASPLVPGIRRALRNRPFRVFLLALVVYAIPAMIPALLMPYFVTYVLAPPDPVKWLGLLLVLYLGVGVLFVPFWVAMSRRFGKLPVWMVCNLIGVVGGALMFFSRKGGMGYVALVEAFVGTQSGAFHFLGPAMIADITDYDELRTGKRREAQYMAFITFVPKFVSIPGASIPLAVLGALGYAPNQVQTAEVEGAIRVMFALVPAAFNAVALFIVARYPLTERLHLAIQDGVARHRAGEKTQDPFTGRVLLPPSRDPGVEEERWFLDHFSRSELEKLSRSRDVPALVRGIGRHAVLSAVVTAGAALLAARSAGGPGERPGPVTVVAVVTAGFALSLTVFHVMRLRAGKLLSRRLPAEDALRASVEAAA